MKQNRVFIILVALMLLLAFTGIANAATVDQDDLKQQVETTVRFAHAQETYTLTIPETIVLLGLNENVSNSVVADLVVLDSTSCLNVTVQSANNWKAILPDKPDKNITYSFEYDMEGGAGLTLAPSEGPFEIMHIDPGTSTATTPIVFTRLTTPPTTGVYSDILTFTVNVNSNVHI